MELLTETALAGAGVTEQAQDPGPIWKQTHVCSPDSWQEPSCRVAGAVAVAANSAWSIHCPQGSEGHDVTSPGRQTSVAGGFQH